MKINDNNMQNKEEEICNLTQANWYLKMLKIPIIVGINIDKNGEKVFYVKFVRGEQYEKFRSIWHKGTRKDR